ISPPLPYTKPQQKCWGFFASVASTKQCLDLDRQPGRISGVPAHTNLSKNVIKLKLSSST
ncbi:hypothetical protein, partial [Vibrio kanaloae]|uniref:hypothetical protein n=1 Tax=Vibrio kanaloae TaxID=170673 RepID=UPI001C9514D2